MSPGPADEAWRRPSPPRFPVLGAVLTVLLITATGLGILVWVSVTLAFGSGSPWGLALVVAALPALLIAGAARMVFAAVLARPPSYWLVAGVGYGVIVLVAGTSVWLAQVAYDASTERAAEACSTDEVAALRGIVLGNALAVDPVGRRDGGCMLEQSIPGSRDAVQASVVAAMADAGFAEAANELGARSFTRDGITVVAVVGLTDEQGRTRVTLTVPDR